MNAPRPDRSIDLAAIRQRLAGTRGRVYWRSLEEVAQTPDFLAWLEGEFPGLADSVGAAVDRRRFLQVMAASIAMAGLGGCGPEPKPRWLVPQIEAPPGVVPGVPRYFATATTLDGFATGVLLKHDTGRPIKVEGNPQHPASLGATSPWGQASILGLYDPERSQAVVSDGRVRSPESLVTALNEKSGQLLAKHGKGLRLLTGTVTSPTLAAQIGELRKSYPEASWHQWEPVNRDEVRDGATLAFGGPVDTVLDLAKSDVILAIESDFLSYAPGHLRYARQFGSRRRAAEIGDRMSRLYAIESAPTLAGAMADHRWALRPDEVLLALHAVAAAIGAIPDQGVIAAGPPWAVAIGRDLLQHRGAALVHVGREQPAEAHALAHLMNEALGAPGSTLRYIDPVEAEPVNQAGSLADLVDAMNAGAVDTLLILGSNPAFTAPIDLGFPEALGRVPLSVHLGTHFDETAQHCRWHVPEAHEYETWSDARGFDGTVTILQPQVRPFYGGKSAHELLALFQGEISPDGYALLRQSWQRRAEARGEKDFEDFWRQSLRDGVVAATQAKPADAKVQGDLAGHLRPPLGIRQEGQVDVLFRPDEAVWDGRFANNGWLQEMPRRLTTLTWDNAALVAPETAQRLGLKDEDVVELRAENDAVRAPVLILPGLAPDCITLPLGQGRATVGQVGAGVGFDAYRLRASQLPWRRDAVEVVKTRGHWPLAVRQHHHTMAGREIVRTGALDEFLHDRDFLKKQQDDERRRRGAVEASLYPAYRYDGNAWAMAINLNSCIGCGACVLACQAENNIAVVGKEEVLRGHEMHWLRVDRYFSGPVEAPDIYFQPVPCMHCENAPCEVVCPVQATMHDSDGLNVMVYNRCVGTRFCSNNCPYKVRRFNFFDYTSKDNRPRESWNPDLSVRGRGVMEKCTYCVQRIREAKIASSREDRAIRDGEVVTACQQACPTEAIIFGDRNMEQSAVVKRKASPLDYALLDELNTRPRTTYEARLRNPNPEIPET